MRSRYTAILLTIGLTVAFVAGLFLEPTESQANPGTGWTAEYFNNRDLSGAPVVTVIDDSIGFNWAEGSPRAGVNSDNFSVRWTASPTFVAGTYRFRAGADDGIRVYIDNVLVINEWAGGPFRIATRDVQLSAGQHQIKVEYYDSISFAGALFDWTVVAATGPTATVGPSPTPGPTQTPTPSGAIDSQGRPYGHVATGVLNVRANPSVSAARLTQVYLYQRYPIVGITENGNWYLIELPDGRTGWVAERYIYRIDGGIAVPVVQVAASSEAAVPNIEVSGYASQEVKIRAFPRTGEQVGLVLANEFVRVLGRNSSGAWYYVQTASGIEGWVFAPYIVLTNGRVMDIPIR